jgi:hypothetical protein
MTTVMTARCSPLAALARLGREPRSLPFQDPATDSRTPDIIGIARVGVIYTGGSKIAEHGGFNEDDTHVALIVASAGLKQSVVSTAVTTTQIAPTILQALGLDPNALNAVRMEGTTVLPGLGQ